MLMKNKEKVFYKTKALMALSDLQDTVSPKVFQQHVLQVWDEMIVTAEKNQDFFGLWDFVMQCKDPLLSTLLQSLVDHHIDVNSVCLLPCKGQYINMYPLHLAVLRQNYHVMYWLLNHGADVNAVNDVGMTAYGPVVGTDIIPSCWGVICTVWYKLFVYGGPYPLILATLMSNFEAHFGVAQTIGRYSYKVKRPQPIHRLFANIFRAMLTARLCRVSFDFTIMR